KRLLDFTDPRPDQRTAIAADDLEIDLVMPRVDRGDHWLLAALADDWRGVGRKRGQTDGWFSGRERQSPRGGEPNTQSRKTAGTGGYRDAVERGKRQRGLLHYTADQWHQRLGMSALHRLRFDRDQLAGAGIEHGGRAGVERGIDGEDQHDASSSML